MEQQHWWVAPTITANDGQSIGIGNPPSSYFAIGKATLTVTANSFTRQTVDPNPTLTASYSGIVSGDTLASAVTGSPILSTTATSSSPVGVYPITITQGTLASTNYSFVFVPGTLTVIDTIAPTLVDFRLLYGNNRSYSLMGSSRFDVPWQITGIQAVFSESVLGDSNSLAGWARSPPLSAPAPIR